MQLCLFSERISVMKFDASLLIQAMDVANCFLYYFPLGKGKWACFEWQDIPGKSIFLKTLIHISTICGLFMPTFDAILRRNSVARFDVGRDFQFFERLMYILICYHNDLQLLNCKLLFRLAIVVLLGYCEFNPSVT